MRINDDSQYRCILADPPWPIAMAGQRKRAKEGRKPDALPYPTMTIEDICALPVADFAAEDCHLWLWTTNQNLEDGFKVMRAWGFKYLAPVHWVKPTGMGNWFVHRSQTMLFGYHKKCRFPLARYRPNVFQTGDPKRHSEKPDASYELIEAVSPGPRLELFARRKRGDWHTWGNEVPCDVSMGHNVLFSGPAIAGADQGEKAETRAELARTTGRVPLELQVRPFEAGR